MKFTELSIPGLILVEPDVWTDDRGLFLETYHATKYADGKIAGPFAQDNHSHSRRDVLRGLHYQRNHPQGKLVYAVRGEIFDVVVDVRRGSPAFGKWASAVLSDQNHHQLYVPEGCVHGFCVLSDVADVTYKCTTIYVPSDDQGVIWNDPTFAVDWPIKNPILSAKDSKLPRFTELSESILPAYEPK